MTANEVMIGDWVSYKGKMPCKITAICKDMAVVDNDSAQDWGIDYDKLIPIPLTKEILKKNGFEECRIEEIEYYGWRLNEEFSLELNAVDTLMWNDDVTIHYVHQLQHALRLCNIDKEIKL